MSSFHKYRNQDQLDLDMELHEAAVLDQVRMHAHLQLPPLSMSKVHCCNS